MIAAMEWEPLRGRIDHAHGGRDDLFDPGGVWPATEHVARTLANGWRR